MLFRHAALRVCAVQDGHLLVLHALGVQAQDLPADKAGLALLVRQGRDQDRLALAPLGPKALALPARVVGDDGVGRLEDAVGGAVVLLELYRVAVLVVLLKVEDVADVRAAPAVDGLVVVAHDAQVVLPRGQGVDELVLHAVGVLVLVHQDVFEQLLVARQHVRGVAQQDVGLQEQVVEVHRAVALAALAVDM